MFHINLYRETGPVPLSYKTADLGKTYICDFFLCTPYNVTVYSDGGNPVTMRDNSVVNTCLFKGLHRRCTKSGALGWVNTLPIQVK